jgi:hypothetical protein
MNFYTNPMDIFCGLLVSSIGVSAGPFKTGGSGGGEELLLA